MRTIIHSENVAHMSNNEVTRYTLHRMASLADSDCDSPYILDVIWSIAEDQRTNDSKMMVQGIFNWIKRNLKFTQDPELIMGWFRDRDAAMDCEVLTSPVRLVTMKRMRGDCDDFAILGRCLLKACGIASVFVTVKADLQLPEEWSHVYLDVYVDGKWIPFDPSYGRYVGWEAPNTWERKAWNI